MLERHGLTGLVHALKERRAVAAGGGRVVPVLPLQRADRLILRVESGRDDIHDGSEVQVDAGGPELLPPAGGAALERRGGPAALHKRARHR